MEMTSHKLIDLFFTLSMKILKLMQIPLDIEPIRSENVWLPLHQMLALQPSDLTHSGEDMSKMSRSSLNAVSVIDPTLSSLMVTVKLLQIVIEVGVSGTQVSERRR